MADKIKYCNKCNEKQVMTYSGSGTKCSCPECLTEYVDKNNQLIEIEE